MRKIAANGSAIADLRVRNMRQRFGDKRHTVRDRRIALQSPVARERTNAHVVARTILQTGKCRKRVNVNEHRRLGQPEIHRWNKALTAGQKTRFVAMLGFERQSLLDALSGNIAKRRWFHAVARSASQWDDVELSK